jgi:hypothetical protein
MGWLNLIVAAMLAGLGLALTGVLVLDGAELIQVGLVIVLFGGGAVSLMWPSPAWKLLRGRRRR